MKKFFITLLAIVVIVGALGGAGFTGYRIGYVQGARVSANGAPQPLHRFEQFGPDRMPLRNFRQLGRGFGYGFGPGRFPMGQRVGFGIFGPFMFIGRIAIWGLALWFIFWLFTKSGWQLTRTSQPANISKEVPAATESPKTDE